MPARVQSWTRASRRIGRRRRSLAYVAQYNDLVWVLDDAQRASRFCASTPSAFDDDRGAWGLCLAEAYALMGDAASRREFTPRKPRSRPSRNSFAAAPDDDAAAHSQWPRAGLPRPEGRGDPRRPAGRRARSRSRRTRVGGAYDQHQLARIYILVGEPEKALDQLEPLLKIPYLPLARLAQDRPELRSAAQEPAIPEARRRREVIPR